ncbi:fibronectin type III domain-containing protein [Robiginitalea sp.]|nr:fibronectin type III domain-containing protein [Robiginitalea sp.]
MRLSFTLAFLLSVCCLCSVIGQELHSNSNAASINNEANDINGWSTNADLFSDNSDPLTGNFALRVVSTANGRFVSYSFNAVVGANYTIRIWARQGPQVTNPPAPAFAIWSGFQGFRTTPITSSTWNEYVFNLTARNTNPQIRIYTGTSSSNGDLGNTLFIDGVSITRDGSDTEPPSPITDLIANNTSDTSTELTWTASADNVAVSSYEIFQNGVSIGNSGTNTSFVVNGLTAGVAYSFYILAQDEAGNFSNPSNTIAVTPQDTQGPTAVSDLSSANVTATSVQLTWSPSTDNTGVTNYEIFQDAVSIGNSGSATTFNVTGLTASNTYQFSVIAEDNAGNRSGASNAIDVTTLAPPDTITPSTISDLTASNTSEVSTLLSWSAASDNMGVTNYEIFSDSESIGNVGILTSFSVNGLTPNTNYVFYVVASDNAGNTSLPSNTVSVLTFPDTEAPSPVNDLSASSSTASETLLSWSGATDNIGVSNYQIFQDGALIGNSQLQTTFQVTGLNPTTSYTFIVIAQDVAGNSSLSSNSVNVLTDALPALDTEAPSAVSNLSASNTSVNGTLLSWSPSFDNVGVTNYQIFQDNNNIGNSGTLTSFTVSGLSSETTYVFSIRAQDSAGNTSSTSNLVTVTTTAIPDTTPPAPVSNLSASNTTSNSTLLSWSASSDNVGVVNYAVYRNGTLLSNSGSNTSFSVTGLFANTSYTFTVRAADAAGNLSGNSNTANVTTLSDTGGTSYTSQNANLDSVDWHARDLFASRNLGVGTQNTRGFTLAVAGGILAEELTIELQANWPDYVFGEGYTLPTLEVVERHIQERGHLINVPSSSEIEASGLKVGQMHIVLLEKIEELMLYTIDQEKRIKALEAEILKLHEESNTPDLKHEKDLHN